ncbi:DUF418 domain-containing protein [Promicromonospora sp. NPDC060271]|uniref:DUF418 domain-containing protein n=1 Tax=Promicromonospora sp. NPDC060271 TaxID=3347089 RepID=UPI00365AEA59
MAANTPPSTSPVRTPERALQNVTPDSVTPSTGGRIAALDVLRGLAIIGTLASNIWIFTTPGGPAEWISGGGFATADPAQRVLQTLANGKFLGLLTLLFGVGLELQYRSMVRRGMPWPGRYALRAGILFVEGLVHYILVFEFDVLMGYAIASLLAAYLIGRSDRVVRAWGGVLAGLFVVAIAGATALMVATGGSVAASAGGGGAQAADPAVLSTGSWFDQVLLRLEYVALFRIELILIVPSATVLFLVGSRLVRAGLFTTTEDAARLRRRLAWVGLGAGVPLNALTAWAGPDWFLVDRYLVPPLVAVGILALGTTLVARAKTSGGLLRRGVEGVGRTALSCYVLQNVLASVLCYDWGFGLAGGGPWQVMALWAGISLTLMVLAPLWLRRWPRGPIELLMHRVYDARRRLSSASHSAR